MINSKDLVNALIRYNYTISFAESCTGGLCASSVISVADASKVISESFVTYSNDAKIKYLGVNKDTIETFGVVSVEVAKEMAVGVKTNSKSDIGVSVTGLAGPSGGSENLPVGTVCFAIAIADKTYTYKENFPNLTRNEVREKSVEFIFEKLIEILK